MAMAGWEKRAGNPRAANVARPNPSRRTAVAPASSNNLHRAGRRGPPRKGASTYFQDRVATIVVARTANIVIRTSWEPSGKSSDIRMKTKIGQCQR